MNEQLNSLKEAVRQQVQGIVAGGKDVSKRVSEVVAGASEQFQRSGAGLVELAQAVMDGAVSAVEKSLPQQPENVLRQVIDGLGEGINRAALTAQLTLEEARSRQVTFAAEDLAQVREDLQALNSLYLETISRGLGQVRAYAVGERERLQQHAAAAWEKMRPAMQSALSAAAQHPVELGKETLKSGVSATRQAAGAFFGAMGHWLDEAGRRLQGP